MDSRVNLWLARAANELLAAQALYSISQDLRYKKENKFPAETTFYSAVIGHAYYGIFYAVRAALLSEKIEITSPDIHNKAYNRFKNVFFDTGKLQKHLLQVYSTAFIRADDLLNIVKTEKKKRGDFTYTTTSEANKEPAEDSLTNANLFVSHIRTYIQKKR